MTQTDEERRKLLKPSISLDVAKSIIDNLFANGSSSSTVDTSKTEILKQLDSYDDVNFLITVDGTKRVLKIHNGVESDNSSVIEFQDAVMDHINDANILTSKCVNKTIMALPVVSAAHSPYNLVVRVLTYIDGCPMAYKSVTPQMLLGCGEFLGGLDKSLDLIDLSKASNLTAAAQRFHQWDTKNTATLRAFTKYITSEEKRSLVNSVIDEFERIPLEDISLFRVGVNQSDFNDANIIIGDDDKIKGVIDFGDSIKR